MKKIRTWINSYVESANIKRVLIAAFIFGILTYIIDYSPIGVDGLLKVTNGANILDFENGYSLDKAYSMLTQLGEAGRNFHLTKIMPVDIFFPMGLMFFGSSLLALLLKKLTKTGSPLRLLTGLTVLNMLCDWGENVGITLMLINFPVRLQTVCMVSSIITQVKFVFVKLIAVSVAVCLILILIKTIQKAILSCKKVV